MFKQLVSLQCTRYQKPLAQRMMIDYIVVSSDLRPFHPVISDIGVILQFPALNSQRRMTETWDLEKLGVLQMLRTADTAI